MISAAALILILCLSVVGYLVVRNGSDSKNVVAQVTDDSEDGSKNGGVEDSQDSPSSKADDLGKRGNRSENRTRGCGRWEPDASPGSSG